MNFERRKQNKDNIMIYIIQHQFVELKNKNINNEVVPLKVENNWLLRLKVAIMFYHQSISTWGYSAVI